MKKILILVIALFSLSGFSQDKVLITNSKLIPEIVKDFVDGCKYYKVDFQEKLQLLQSVRIVEENSNFLGSVQGNTININSELENYPNLFRVVLFHQLGKYFGLEKDTSGKRYFMADSWTLNPIHEGYAYKLRQNHIQERIYFTKLQKLRPLDKVL